MHSEQKTQLKGTFYGRRDVYSPFGEYQVYFEARTERTTDLVTLKANFSPYVKARSRVTLGLCMLRFATINSSELSLSYSTYKDVI